MVQTIINYELTITNYELTPSKSKSCLSFNSVNPDSDIVLNRIFLILRWTGFWGGQNQENHINPKNHGSDNNQLRINNYELRINAKQVKILFIL